MLIWSISGMLILLKGNLSVILRRFNHSDGVAEAALMPKIGREVYSSDEVLPQV